MPEIYDLEWDVQNEDHLSQHRIKPSEVRELLWNTHLTKSNPAGGAGTLLLIGSTNGGRTLTVSVAPTLDATTWRPVTGWDSTSDEATLLAKYGR